METLTNALTGPELAKFVKENSESMSQTEMARACGYVSPSKSGKETVRMNKFHSAVLAANGINLKHGSSSFTKTLRYKTTIHANGNLLIGAAYTDRLNLEGGTIMDIEPLPDGSGFTVRVSEDQEEEVDEEEEEEEAVVY